MQEHIKADTLKRLNYIEGHLAGIRRMIESDQYCVDVLKQTRAVRRAIEALEAHIMEGHLGDCVVEGIKGGREAQIIQELSELYKIANR